MISTEADAFLVRIRELPEDDGPRLVYADWLDDHGDPLGEFIRVQLALARLPTAHRRRAELQRDEADLLARYQDVWSSSLRGIASGPIFRRGFIEEINVTARQLLAHPHEVFAAGPIQHVHLLDLGSHLTEILHSPLLSRLSQLTIYAQYLGEPLARAFADCPHPGRITGLHLGRNRIGDAGVDHLLGSPMLPHLKELDLSENDLGEPAARSLAMNRRWPEMTDLNLAGNAIGPLGTEALLRSPATAHLERLNLEGVRLGGPRLLQLPNPLPLLQLTAVNLAGNDLTAPMLEQLLFGSTARLRELDLSRNGLGDAGAARLAGRPQLAGLRELRLSANQITDAGLAALAQSPYLTRLNLLDLSNNPVGDEGFRQVLESKTLRNLKTLIPPGIGLSFRMRLTLEMRYNRASLLIRPGLRA